MTKSVKAYLSLLRVEGRRYVMLRHARHARACRPCYHASRVIAYGHFTAGPLIMVWPHEA